MILIAVTAMAAGTVLGLYSQRAIWEGWVSDRLLQLRAAFSAPDEAVREPVAVVGLDRVSLASDRLASVPRVFMTPVMAEAGQAVLDAGALAVGYDFVFAFSADAFADPVTAEQPLRGFDRPFLGFLYKNRGKIVVAKTSTGVPHRAISAAAGVEGVRLAEVTPDGDGVVRWHTPGSPLAQSPKFIDALLHAAGGNAEDRYIAVPERRLATSVPYLSLIDVLSLAETEEGRESLKEFAAGRVILFGSTLPNEDEHLYSGRFLPSMGLEDAETGDSGRPPLRYATAGVFILADLIGAPLSDRTAVDPPAASLYLAAAVFAVAGALAGLALALIILPLAAIGLAAAGLAITLVGLEAGYFVPPGVAPVAAVSALGLAVLGKVGILQRRERSLVRLFGHYLAPDVIKQMATSEQLPELGGETRPVIVAFIDIVGFTKMSERLPDHEVVRVVNTCFDAIGEVITKHEGYIDKYIGDAIMAVWNAPNKVAHPERAAVEAARDIIHLLDELKRITGQSGLDLRIALNGGPVLVGDIGGIHRRSFTVMGTTVNTASRIESVAKDHSVRLAFSAPVADPLGKDYPLVRLWSGQLRGLTTETVVYTLDDAAMFMEGAPARPERTEAETSPRVVQIPR
ncbi:adenylate/guanylate cyclase domain-containing protein [Roseibium denhamense]|uniref:Adenylate cyclase n=1 Tax=Roseibium denhamense TaxID=76305 RepID=A0ABY1NQS0_9HYPH|nr:adenylate/guanylate cyclase domain-containing protein [Roseibium denhamense]SMP15891.1 adenylate cyclase [Roseibium denhamense]